MLSVNSILSQNGSVTAPSVTFTSELNSGLYLSNIQELSLSTVGVQRVIISNVVKLLNGTPSTNAQSGYQKLYIDSTTGSLSRFGTAGVNIETLNTTNNQQIIFRLANTTYDATQINNLAKWYATDTNIPTSITTTYTTASTDSYHTCAYHPFLDRVYFVPWTQALQTTWHYGDGTGVVSYSHGVPTGEFDGQAYAGGCWDPIQKRLYFSPYNQGQGSVKPNWHYINSSGTVTSYTHGLNSSQIPGGAMHFGAVYHPKLKRIYFIPHSQFNQSTLFYIDCTNGSINTYSNTATVKTFSAYRGGCWDPINERIWFTPFNQSNQAKWHYIDATGTLVEYTHGFTIAANAYSGCIYDPIKKRIYWAPMANGSNSTWHYVDCTTGNVVAYTHGVTAVSNAYQGGCYIPTQARIYLTPWAQTSSTKHYIDCTSGNVVAYTTFSYSSNLADGAYHVGSNRMYMAMWNNTSTAYAWGFDKGNIVSRAMMASTLFNNY